jgi:AraC family transcriptional regulator, transcriptional activator of pobA
MNELFIIYKMGVEEAEKIASSPNDPHVHDYEELLVGMEGNLQHFIDFSEKCFRSPYISFITKGKAHRVKPLVSEGKCSIWVIRFRTEFIPETTYQLYSYYHDHANIEIDNEDSFSRMVMLCEMMNAEMLHDDPDMPVVRDLLRALFTMIESERQKMADQNYPLPPTHNTTFKNFLRILEENYRRPEGVEFYSSKLFMSARNLNLICQSILHQTATELIESRKLTEAKNQLIYTDKSVSEIGYELGFNEKAYFTTVFRKKSGQTPTEFRDEMRKLIK